MTRYCVLAALRNVRAFVPTYRRTIEQFEQPPSRVILLENDSRDGTAAALHAWSPGPTWWSEATGQPYFPRLATADRAAHLAAVRNKVIVHALAYDDWEYALFLDAQKYLPARGPTLLLEAGGDIVAPHVAVPGGPFYDTWCFRHLDGRPFEEIADGRPHFATGGGLTEVQSVGGVYMVRRAVLEAGVRLAGTDGHGCDSVPFCAQARALGFRVWVHWGLQAVHAPTAKQCAWYQSLREPVW